MTADLSNEALDALVEDLADAIAATEVDRSTDAEDAESTGERVDLWEYEVPLELDRARELYAAITALRARVGELEAEVSAQEDRANENKARFDRAEAALRRAWGDRTDDLTAEIGATHPFAINDWPRYNRAAELVSNRHSKGALIDLVAYLLRAEAQLAEARADALKEALDTIGAIDGKGAARCRSALRRAILAAQEGQ